jgi:membrane protease subunit HflC
MNRNLAIGLLGLAVVAVLLAGNSVYVVDQRQQAVVLRLGVPDHTVNAPGQDNAGLQVKIPLAETVVRFYRENQALEIDGQDMRAADQQHLVVDAVLRYRIVDPLTFMHSLGDDQGVRARLTPLIAGALRERVGALKAGDVIAGGQDQVSSAALGDIAARVKAAKMGIQLIDLSLKHIGLPPTDQAAITDRMKAQRLQEAAQIKAQGDLDVAAARAAGDNNAKAILAGAQEDAGRIKGEGDAKSAALYAESYGRDPQFADFYRSMQAYERTMESGGTTIVLSSDSGFLKYFKNGPGK